MADPSDSMANTCRSGQAIAAPSAAGRPWPMEPPVMFSQSWGRAPAVWAWEDRPDVTASSETMVSSGIRCATAAHTFSMELAPVGKGGGSNWPARAGSGAALISSASIDRAPITSSSDSARTWYSQSGGAVRLGWFG